MTQPATVPANADRTSVLFLWTLSLLLHAVAFLVGALCIWPDTANYLDYGRSLLTEYDSLVPSKVLARLPPLYPVWLTVQCLLLPQPLISAALVNHLLFSFVPVVLYILLYPVSRGAARFAAGLSLISLPLYTFPNGLLTETIYLPLLLGVCWAAVETLRRRTWPFALALGLLVALLPLVRPIGLLLVVPLTVLLLWFRARPLHLLFLWTPTVLAVALLLSTAPQGEAGGGGARSTGRFLFSGVLRAGDLVRPEDGPAAATVWRSAARVLDRAEDFSTLSSAEVLDVVFRLRVPFDEAAGGPAQADTLLWRSVYEGVGARPFRFAARITRHWTGRLVELVDTPGGPHEVTLPLSGLPGGEPPSTWTLVRYRKNRDKLLLLGPRAEALLAQDPFPAARVSSYRALRLVHLPTGLLLALAGLYLLAAPRRSLADPLYLVPMTVVVYHLAFTALLAGNLLARYRDVLYPLVLLCAVQAWVCLSRARVGKLFDGNAGPADAACAPTERGRKRLVDAAIVLVCMSMALFAVRYRLVAAPVREPLEQPTPRLALPSAAAIPLAVPLAPWLALQEVQLPQEIRAGESFVFTCRLSLVPPLPPADELREHTLLLRLVQGTILVSPTYSIPVGEKLAESPAPGSIRIEQPVLALPDKVARGAALHPALALVRTLPDGTLLKLAPPVRDAAAETCWFSGPWVHLRADTLPLPAVQE